MLREPTPPPEAAEGGPASARRARLLVALAAAVGAGGVPTALAQGPSPAVPSRGLGTIRCTAAAATPLVRSEGSSELIGDIVLTCRNDSDGTASAGRGFVEADLALTLNVDFANRSDYGKGADAADAVLVINGNHCIAPGAEREFGECGLATETIQDAMLARKPGPRLLRWDGIALPVPGAAIGTESTAAAPVSDCTGRFAQIGGCHPPVTTLRLTNLRANAAQLGALGGPSLDIRASVSLSAASSEVVLEQGSADVAVAAPGLLAETRPLDAVGLCARGEGIAEIVIAEGFAAAFKPAGEALFTPGEPGWKDSFYPYARFTSDGEFGVGATRLRITLGDLPTGLEVAAPAHVSCASSASDDALQLALVEGADAQGLGGSRIAGGGDTLRTLQAAGGGAAVAVYEVVQADLQAQEKCRLPLRFTRARGARLAEAHVGVAVDLAPVGPPASASGSATEPRFVAFGRSPQGAFHVRSCGTTLFFPFVTSRSNFDTAIVIANTSRDPLGTRYQEGRCTLQFHGSGGEGRAEPSAQTTGALEAGEQLAFTLTDGNPAQGVEAVEDFQGYLVATCAFRHAYGFAFVTEQVSGTAVLSQGYLAEPVRPASTVTQVPAEE